MHYLITRLTCFWTLLMPVCLEAQQLKPNALSPDLALYQYRLKTWESIRDIPASHIWDIEQDSFGYLWIATQSGVLKFDGARFSKYDLSNVAAFQNEDFRNIEIEVSGRIWLSAADGLYQYNGSSFNSVKGLDGQPIPDIADMTLDRAGRLWILSQNKLLCLENDAFRSLPESVGNILAIHPGNNDTLWISTVDGKLWSYRNGVLTEHPEIATHLPFPVRAILETPDGRMFFGLSTTGLYKWEDNRMQALFAENERLWSTSSRKLLIDSNEKLWVASNAGIFRTDGKTIENYSQEDGFSDHRIRTLFEDREGSIWLGTYEGLNAVMRSPAVYLKLKTASEHIKINTHVVLEDSKGNTWVGDTFQGLLLKEGKSLIKAPGADKLPGRIRSMVETARGTFLVASAEGLYEISYVQKRIRVLRKITDGHILFVFQRANGDIWLSQVEDFADYGTYIISQGQKKKVEALSPDGPQWILEKGNTLWIGTSKGLFKEEGGNIISYGEEEGLFSRVIHDYAEDGQGGLWLATKGSGLVHFDNGRFAYFNSRNGFPANDIAAVVTDAEGGFWFAGTKGVYRTDWDLLNKKARVDSLTELPFEFYPLLDGINSWGFPKHSGSAGQIRYMSASPGVVMIDPSLRWSGNVVPFVESVKLNGNDLTLTDTISLSPKWQNLEIHYGTIDFYASEQAMFEYKLEGFDEEWQSVQNRRVAYYTRLPAGNYEFKVRLQGQTEALPEASSTLVILQQQVWWKTNWVLAFFILLILFILRVFYLWRIKTIKKKNYRLQQTVDERTEELQQLLKSLEDKVDARTKELTRANHELNLAMRAGKHALFNWSGEDMEQPHGEYSADYYEMLGYEPYEFEMGMNTWIEMIHPDDQDRVRVSIDKITGLSGSFENEFNYQYRLRKKTGDYIWVEATGRIISRDEKGIVTQLTGLITNINDRKEAELLIKESEERFGKVFDGSSNGMLLVDDEGSIELFNKEASKIFGYESEEWKKLKVEDLVPQASRKGHSGKRGQYYKERVQRPMGGDRDLTALRKDGSQVPVQIGLSPLMIKSRSYTLAVVVDMTDRVESERALRLSEEQLRYALEASSDGIWDWDMETDEIRYSPAIFTMLGYEPGELAQTRQAFIELHHPDDNEPKTTDEQLRLARMLRKEAFSSEYRLKTKSGEYIWVQSKGKAVAWDEHGVPTRLVGTQSDITENKRKTQEILEAVLNTEDNERSRISKEIHDGLQQTLTITALNLEFIKRELDKLGTTAQKKFETGWEYLQKSIAESRSVAHALMPKAIEDYGLVSAIESLLDEMHRSIDSIEFLFDHNIKGDIEENQAVTVSLYRILQEALNNIIKYAGATRVMVQLKNYDDILMLTIEDNGRGFDVEKVRSKEQGFGLKSMENRMEAIAGHIEIDSHPERGTSIIVQVSKDKIA